MALFSIGRGEIGSIETELPRINIECLDKLQLYRTLIRYDLEVDNQNC